MALLSEFLFKKNGSTEKDCKGWGREAALNYMAYIFDDLNKFPSSIVKDENWSRYPETAHIIFIRALLKLPGVGEMAAMLLSN